MKDDIRYSEFLFLCGLEKTTGYSLNSNDQQLHRSLGLQQGALIEMVTALIEDLYVKFDRDDLQKLVGRLRGELYAREKPSQAIEQHEWDDPRTALFNTFTKGNFLRLNITYRGRRRIEELRELLKRDRIFEPFGVLLDVRYFAPDCADALQRETNTPVSVIRLDLDNFKRINDEFGHPAGDLVLTSYLEMIRDCLGSFGTGFRAGGDEVVALIVGIGHERAAKIAEKIRHGVEAIHLEYKGKKLKPVTTSIGVATSPPAPRSLELETLADDRQRRAKMNGKNCVIADDVA